MQAAPIVCYKAGDTCQLCLCWHSGIRPFSQAWERHRLHFSLLAVQQLRDPYMKPGSVTLLSTQAFPSTWPRLWSYVGVFPGCSWPRC